MVDVANPGRGGGPRTASAAWAKSLTRGKGLRYQCNQSQIERRYFKSLHRGKVKPPQKRKALPKRKSRVGISHSLKTNQRILASHNVVSAELMAGWGRRAPPAWQGLRRALMMLAQGPLQERRGPKKKIRRKCVQSGIRVPSWEGGRVRVCRPLMAASARFGGLPHDPMSLNSRFQNPSTLSPRRWFLSLAPRIRKCDQ